MLTELLARAYARFLAKRKDEIHNSAVVLRIVNQKIDELRKLQVYADTNGYSQAIHYLLEQEEDLCKIHKQELEDWFRKYNLNPKDYDV
jgi:hypothetical protein